MNTAFAKDLLSAAAEKYNYRKGWSSCAQPLRSAGTDIYLELARQAMPALRQQMVDFCAQQNLTHIVIPHEDFELYEKSALSFRKWLDGYCQERGLSPHAQVAIVGPCVKDEASAQRKNELDPADRIKDYARGMFVFLSGPTPKYTRQSLDRMGDAIASVEAAIELGNTLAWKNTLHTPKFNGYRDHKSIWLTEITGDQLFAGEQVLSEVKIEHESVQDLNRMTRRFMGVERYTTQVLPEFFARCAGRDAGSRNTSNNYSRIDHRLDVLNDFSRKIYSHAFAKIGLDRFLDPELAKQKPATADQVYAAAKKVIETFGQPFKRELDIVTQYVPKLRGLAPHLTHA